jgi:hypothetical protein
MEKIKTETVIPVVLDPKSKRQGSPTSAKTGLPVQVFVWPACRFVEFYDIQGHRICEAVVSRRLKCNRRLKRRAI